MIGDASEPLSRKYAPNSLYTRSSAARVGKVWNSRRAWRKALKCSTILPVPCPLRGVNDPHSYPDLMRSAFSIVFR